MIVSFCCILVYEVAVVGADEFDAILLRELYKLSVHLLLHGERLAVCSLVGVCHLMALKFQIEVLAPQVFMPFHSLPRSFYIACQYQFGNLTTDAC